MGPSTVAIVRYYEKNVSVRDAAERARLFDDYNAATSVFIKPNIVCWLRGREFPKYGVITTSRVVEDIIILLKERGVSKITIGEGVITIDQNDEATRQRAFESLGYPQLKKKYGVEYIDIFKRHFKKVALTDGLSLGINEDILAADRIVDLPVLKTHGQTMVSLAIKNLKGTLDMRSRKRCHRIDQESGYDLHRSIAHIASLMPPAVTLIDGIFSLEIGPINGVAHRTDLLIASRDILAADMIGARVLGFDPAGLPHLKEYGSFTGRTIETMDIAVSGELLSNVITPHKHQLAYNDENTMVRRLAKIGVSGVDYPKFDQTLCTYCAITYSVILAAIGFAWKGKPWDDVEILSGKVMRPTPGKKKTIVIGQCLYEAYRDDPSINDLIPIRGCPAKPADIHGALAAAGIEVDRKLIEELNDNPFYLLDIYRDRPEFSEDFYRIEA